MTSDGRAPKIWFLGGGPGAEDLLTVRAARALAQADVVLWGKNLLSDAVVSEHARRDAELVPWPPATKADIEAIYDRATTDGLHVAWLLWGDPSLFSSLREEVQKAGARGLDCEVVPGISAFNAAAAMLAIELTKAPESSRPLILTQGRGDPVAIRDLAAHGGTMAIFMIGELAEELQRELIAGGYEPQARCVIAHKITRDEEVMVTCRLDELAATVAAGNLDSHSLVLVGAALEEGGPGVTAPA